MLIREMSEEDAAFLMKHFGSDPDQDMRLVFQFIDAHTNTDGLIAQAASDDADLMDDIPVDWEAIFESKPEQNPRSR